MVSAKDKKKRVAVAMSGGVDSSVAAALLQQAGHEVFGVSMKLWENDFCGRAQNRLCCSTKDIDDARFVAGQLEMPFYSMDLSREFKKEVMDYFSSEYAKGRTPNPCIVCNDRIKFGTLFEKVKLLGADYLATGHYAKAGYNKKLKRFVLSRGRDRLKDQSYVLFGLTQNQLKSALFPLGGYLKSEIRQLSKKFGIKVSEKPESQDICFAWGDNYHTFLSRSYGIKPVAGDIVDTQGKLLGRHKGIMFYTIGQRHGLGLGGSKEPLYVTAIDAKNNTITVGPRKELEKDTFFADVGANGRSPLQCKVQIRYNHLAATATIQPAGLNCVKVVFDRPQSAITPGQAVVFYKGDKVLGGGWIR